MRERQPPACSADDRRPGRQQGGDIRRLAGRAIRTGIGVVLAVPLLALRVLAETGNPSDARIIIAMSKGLDRLVEQGRLYEATREFDKAVVVEEKVLALCTETLGERDALTLKVMRHLAGLYGKVGRYSEAEGLYQRILILDPGLSVDTLERAADMHGDATEFAKAEAFYKQALAMLRSPREPQSADYARVVEKLAALYASMGNYAGAEPLYQEALRIKEKTLGPLHLDTAYTLMMLATLYFNAGKEDDAERLCRRALKIQEDAAGVDSPLLGVVLNVLGQICTQQRKYDEAEQCLKRAVRLTGGLHTRNPCRSMLSQSLGQLYRAKGDYAGAIEFNARGEVALENELGSNHMATADCSLQQSLLWAELGVPAKSLVYARKAWPVYIRHRDRIFAFATQQEQAAFARLMGLLFGHTLALSAERLAADPQASELALEVVLATKCAILDALTRRQGALGRHAEADPALRKLMEEWRTVCVLQDASEMEVSDSGTDEEARRERLETLEKRRLSLEATLARNSAWFDDQKRMLSVRAADIGRVLPAGSALVEYVCYFSDLPTQIDPREWSGIRYRSLERLNLLPQGAKPPTEVQPLSLPSATATHTGEWRYAAIVLTGAAPGTKRTISVLGLGKADSIDQAISRWRQRVVPASPESAAGRMALETAARELAGLVWSPVETALKGEERVYISPDRDLAFVSFAALPCGGDGQLIIDRYDIAYLATGRDLARRLTETGQTPPVLVGAPDFGVQASRTRPAARPAAPKDAPKRGSLEGDDWSALSFGPLPASMTEIRDIAEVLKNRKEHVSILTGPQATEEAVKAVKHPSILHVASHGFYLAGAGLEPGEQVAGTRGIGGLRPAGGQEEATTAARFWRQLQSRNPMRRSGLALAGANDTVLGRRPAGGNDGILTADEVADMDLWGTRMVVVSACVSGLGQATGGEGVFGLRRACALAGAESLVLSLWPVPDNETRTLMTAMYRDLEGDRSPSLALLGAQRAWIAARRKANAYPHPFEWAAFVASGTGPCLQRP